MISKKRQNLGTGSMLGHRILGKFENVLTPPPLTFGTLFQTQILFIKI